MQDKIIEVIAENLGLDKSEVSESTSLFGSDMDSLDRIGLFFDLQEDFGVTIPEQEASKMRTVGDILQYVSKVAA